jgi:hypothetical protein
MRRQDLTAGLVYFPEDPDDVVPALGRAQALIDDRYWSRHVTLPFTWQRFMDWWVSRRWVVPRDVRRSEPRR